MPSPILQVLPFVLTSGFVYKIDCITAASTCKNWCRIWKEVEEQLPESAKVQVAIHNISTGRKHKNQVPAFLRGARIIESVESSQVFARCVLDVVNRCKVLSKKGKTAQKRCQDNLPVWGKDIRWVNFDFWGPNSYNSGGICLQFRKGGSGMGRPVEMVRLDTDFMFWTIKTLRFKTWAKFYTWEPVWPVNQDETDGLYD